VEQFFGVFLVVAVVMWLCIYIPGKVSEKRAKAEIDMTSGEKFSESLRVLRQIRHEEKLEQRAADAVVTSEQERLPSKSVFQAQMPKRVKSAPVKQSGISKFFRSLVNADLDPTSFNLREVLPHSQRVCQVMLPLTVLSWILAVVTPFVNFVAAAAVTVAYLLGLLYYNVNHNRGATGHASLPQSAAKVRENGESSERAHTNAAAPEGARFAHTNPAERKYTQKDEELIRLKAQNHAAQIQQENAKILVGNFRPQKTSAAVSPAMVEQLEQIKSLTRKIDAEAEYVTGFTKRYKQERRAVGLG
jgi:hypothetical protein